MRHLIITVCDAGRVTVDAAYNAMVADLSRAWMSPEQRISDAQRVTADAPPAGVDPRAWARELSIRETRDAWKKPPPPLLDANGPEIASTTRAMPYRPPGAWGPSGYGAKAGDPCMNNSGEAGVLREKDGWLYCEVTPLGPSRAAPTNPQSDSMTADQAQAVRDQAYQQYCSDLENAWRTT